MSGFIGHLFPGVAHGSVSTMPRMFQALIEPLAGALSRSFGPPLLERANLWINHVIAAEPAAVERLRPHAGRCIELRVQQQPRWCGEWPVLAYRVTPAGLLEWLGDRQPLPGIDLTLTLDASEPIHDAARWLQEGQRPALALQGDAALATDVNWLVENLRWDAQNDLARLVGPAAAHEAARLGTLAAAGLREAASLVRAGEGARTPR